MSFHGGSPCNARSVAQSLGRMALFCGPPGPRHQDSTRPLMKPGVNATLRLLFASQAKGKRKLVLGGFFNSNPTFAPSAGTSNLVQSPTVTQMEMFCSFHDWFCQAIARLLDRCCQFQN